MLVHLTPGGPIVALAGEFADRSTVEVIERQLGLDRPLFEQYSRFLALLVRGDLGPSFFYKSPVLDVVLSHVPATLTLILPSLVFTALIGVPLGIGAARGGRIGALVIVFSLIAFSLSVFWLGHLLRLGIAADRAGCRSMAWLMRASSIAGPPTPWTLPATRCCRG